VAKDFGGTQVTHRLTSTVSRCPSVGSRREFSPPGRNRTNGSESQASLLLVDIQFAITAASPSWLAKLGFVNERGVEFSAVLGQFNN